MFFTVVALVAIHIMAEEGSSQENWDSTSPTAATIPSPTYKRRSNTATNTAPPTPNLDFTSEVYLVDNGQCKINGGWGHTGNNYGKFNDPKLCGSAVSGDSQCNHHMFIFARDKGCYCFKDPNVNTNQCTYETTGFSTYNFQEQTDTSTTNTETPSNIDVYLVDNGQCKINGGWGHTGKNYGQFKEPSQCGDIISKDNGCNKNMFIFASNKGCYCFTDPNANTNQCTYETTGFSTYSFIRVVGADRDENGCIGSAGYSFCESLGICIQSWETDCPVTSTTTGTETGTQVIKIDLTLASDDQCKINGEWGHSGKNYGTFKDSGQCGDVISKDSSCNQNMFIHSPNMGCFCFTDLNVTPENCEYEFTGYSTYRMKNTGSISVTQSARNSRNPGQCKINSDWGHTGTNYGKFARAEECQNKISSQTECNKNLFIFAAGRGCFCFKDSNVKMSDCTSFENTGYSTYAFNWNGVEYEVESLQRQLSELQERYDSDKSKWERERTIMTEKLERKLGENSILRLEQKTETDELESETLDPIIYLSL